MALFELRLKNGTVFENGECGFADGKLWCWLKDVTFAEAFAAFSDSYNISEIHYRHIDKETIYYGFNDIDVIRKTEYEPGAYTVDVRLIGTDIHYEERDIPQGTEDVSEDGGV